MFRGLISQLDISGVQVQPSSNNSVDKITAETNVGVHKIEICPFTTDSSLIL